MAKKVVATLKKEGANKQYIKVIQSIKSAKTGAYTFREQIVPQELLQDALKG